MSDSAVTRRSKAKSDRRSQLIAAAERLIAERGYLAVRLEDICSAVGISGPAIYRHFPNKEALLVELLVGISTRLLAGAQRVTAATEDAAESLNGLVDFHLDFVFGEPDLIRIQDRDLAHLPDAARRQVRRSQRQYVEIWVAVLTQLTPDLAEEDARVMAHAVFGLLNSTPYSARPAVPKAHSRALLRRMTLAALTAS
ncbi:SACE_7040 family transcriptional regulator [Mycolicibacterium fortuitum]|uniref:SACE_7040 family transcriptional regulator n=1 Tax=Mycolicibacterium fortuitum TaxID=1766 RepID=UPI001CE11558|nr:TetR/AcrR family transcriptional regulator [Mycolicibacterium fortuitum]MCA4723681.1 TetR/AcrR family transcriptional regulator [Mycolicibacterium fortuitum]WAY17716.1 TetR/AcrR family transcriptional regulator [Mycolicibacterium fortuitum]